MKENVLIFGFKNFKELFITAFGTKHLSFSLFLSVITTINAFITEYIYDDAKAVYFLLFLIAFDAFTGIWKAVKNKTFSSSRLPRVIVLMILYVCLLGIGWNAARFSYLYFWLPSTIYGIMIGTLIVSLFENLMELGFISKDLYDIVKNKIKSSLGLTLKEKLKSKKN